MAQPTLAQHSRALIIRIAEFLGIADLSGSAAAVPSDAKDLDLCVRLLNDGYRRFINSNVWNFLTPTMSLTLDPTGLGSQCVAADASRYYTPTGFYGEMLGP